MHDYDANDIKRLFGLSAPLLRALIRAGHIRPIKVAAGFRYSFQDLLLLRTVSALRAARIPPRKIEMALRVLSASTPAAPSDAPAPINWLSLAVIGERMNAGQGQYALALEVAPGSGNVRSLGKRNTRMQPNEDAHQHFERGLELEESDAAAARAAYEACLGCDPQHLDARINLGRLLHLAGQLIEAERVYRAAAEASALLSFNLAVLLEDAERESEAIIHYNQALVHDAALADAHFNVARLYERAGDTRASFRHLLAYRRLLEES